MLTGPGAPFANTVNSNITFDSNKLTVSQAGIYELVFWANVSLFPSNTAKVAVKFKVNGSSISTLKVACKSNANGDYGNLAASDYVSLSANDYVQLVVASDTTGNINFESLNLTMNLIKAV